VVIDEALSIKNFVQLGKAIAGDEGSADKFFL
jgi:hypothetical protein